ncbi:MAG TPA: hypothetical protein VJB02_03605 [Coxiellaceae bacterium]|nr:hypothetical protein [Coxiellaceae bacterium]
MSTYKHYFLLLFGIIAAFLFSITIWKGNQYVRFLAQWMPTQTIIYGLDDFGILLTQQYQKLDAKG